ncbi:MAG TPA: hypothetical protein DFS52_11555 [Myxococcales bacterium]|jgi:serine/threonine protein phosphatase PrpC|nr:hypothetical protein [Myxococcales bacterium]
MTTRPKSLRALEAGSRIQIDALELTLGSARSLEAQGWWRQGREASGAAHRVLELPADAVPPALVRAFEIPGVAAPCARQESEGRALFVLREAPGPSLEWLLRRREGLALWDVSLVESLVALFQRVHDAGLFFGHLAPAMFSLAADGSLQLEEPDRLRLAGEASDRELNLFSAPEVAGGSNGGPRSDLFGLGMLAYGLLTGRLPAHRGDLPLPRVYRRSLPHGVATVLSRASAASMQARHESCRAFAEDLRARTVPKGASPEGVSVGAASEIGRIKRQAMPVNQDAWYIGLDAASRRGILLVADGVSTADVGSGDLASGMVREAVRDSWEGAVGEILRTHKGPLPDEWAKAALEAMLEDANARIYAFLKQPIFVGSLGPSTHPPGSTAVLCILDSDKLTVANLGDSRLYLLREGALEQMTVDQDLRTELLQAGRDPRALPDPGALGALTQSVGSFFFDPEGGITSRSLEPEVTEIYLRAGDRLLLCSDGVPDCLGENAEALIARELALGDEPSEIAARLCRLADESLGADNITALVLLAV